jgi:hypothetical protein
VESLVKRAGSRGWGAGNSNLVFVTDIIGKAELVTPDHPPTCYIALCSFARIADRRLYSEINFCRRLT